MPDEVANGATDPEIAAIEAAFGGQKFQLPETKPDETPDTQVAGTTPPETQEEEKPDPVEMVERNGAKIPRQFFREDGNHDINGLASSWNDLRQGHAQSQARVKDLERQLRTNDVPWDQYRENLDFDALKQSAPNFLAGESAEENLVIQSLLKRAHENGVSRPAAEKFIAGFVSDMDKTVGPAPTEEDQDAAVREHLGVNAAQRKQYVGTAIASLVRSNKLSPAAMEMIPNLAKSGPMVEFLEHVLRSRSTGTAPPSGNGATSTVDPEREKRESRKALGVSDEEWMKNGPAIVARWARAHGVDLQT